MRHVRAGVEIPSAVLAAGVYGWASNIRVVERNTRTGARRVRRLHNNITTAGLNFMRDMLAGDFDDGRILYFAVGSSDALDDDAHVALVAETFRKAITDRTDGAVGVLTTTALLQSPEANGQIEEVGWFAGPDASAAADSGVLIARALYSNLKTDSELIQFDRTDSITGVV